jgi:D-alanine-D-alanine ligase
MTKDHFYQRKGLPYTPFTASEVGIVYCTSTTSASGREDEKRADCEVIEVAQAVKSALEEKGYRAELVDLDPTRIADLQRFDWVFNLAESIYGFPLADYEVAKKMEENNIRFTGSGSKTLKACLDKAVTKCELLRNGIGTPAYEVFQPGNKIFNMLGYPLIVKPIREDGSIGITLDSIARNDEELEQRVEKVHRMYSQAALVEEYIEGRDITASVIGNGEEAVVLPLSEITYADQAGPKLLTYKAKWSPDTHEYQSTKARCPCILSLKAEALIKDIALRAYRVMGCRDYARVDFRLRGRVPFVLEVNANPCINPDDSGFVRSSKAAGYSYTDMVMKILDGAVRDRLLVPGPVLEEVLV